MGAAAGSTLNNNIYSWFNFEEASGTRVDELGNYSFDQNTNVPGNRAGVIGNALDCSGTQWVYNGTSVLGIMDGSLDWSISAWVYFDAGGAYAYPFGVWGSGAQRGWLCEKTNLDKFGFWSSSSSSTQSAVDLDISAWNHLVIVHDSVAQSTQLYKNGAAAFTHSGAIPTTGLADMTVGAVDGVSDRLNGAVDLMGIWSRKLTADEVTELYNGGSGKSYPF